jgi:hypothetical protein
MLGKKGDKKCTDHMVRKGDAEMYFTDQGVRRRGDEKVLESTGTVCMG